MARQTTNRKTKDQNSRNSKSASSSILFLIVLILVIVVLALAFKDPLTNLVLSDSSPSPEPSTTNPSPIPSPQVSSSPDLVIIDGAPSQSPAQTSPEAPQASRNPQSSEKPSNAPIPKPIPQDTSKLRSSYIYMIRVQDSGTLSLEKTSRTLDFGDSPLVNTLNVLLKGPDSNEINSGLVSMIPNGTRLLSAWVTDGTAFLNFSENFMFNPLGSEGLTAQLRQVIWTACEFPTVKSVQILIEGKKTDYLGGDNVYVGEALSKRAFN